MTMNEQQHEILSRFLDGELPAGEARQLREQLIADPELRAELDRMRAADERLRAVLDVPAAQKIPGRVIGMLENAETASPNLKVIHRTGWGLAIAASVLAASGILLNPQWQAEDPDAPLAQVLETTPSRATGWLELEDGSEIRPVLSFLNNAGNWCREYLAREDSTSWRGVACRENEQWRTRIVSEVATSPQAQEYRTASAEDSDRIADFIDENAADIALSAAEEAALLARNWQQ